MNYLTPSGLKSRPDQPDTMETMEQASIVIIGGGVVGCAIARALSIRWSDVFVLEALPKIGMGASSRNSGVVHSGLYYPRGSLKARHCLRGNQLTYEFCAAHGVPHRRTGKLVVASSPAEAAELAALLKTGEANGVENMRIIDRTAIRAREPHVEGFQAIEIPSTGIVGSEELVKAYARIASDQGAHIVVHAKVERLEPLRDGIRVTSSAGEIETRCLVNSAGLFADEIARMLGSPMAKHRDLSRARGVLRISALEAGLDSRLGLSSASPRRSKPRRAPDKNSLGQCSRRPYGSLCGRQEQLRARSRTYRSICSRCKTAAA